MKRLIVLAVVVLVAGLAYYRVGWTRMATYCDGGPHPNVHESVHFSWSWKPVGFECTYEDGSSDTTLWPDRDQWAKPVAGPKPEPTVAAKIEPFDIQVVRQHGLTLLTIPEPNGSAGVGAAFKLATLPNGCVVSDYDGPGDDDYRVLLWPAGSTVDATGSIHTEFGYDGGPRTFQIGQRLSGGQGASHFTAESPLLPKAATEACPGPRYEWMLEADVFKK